MIDGEVPAPVAVAVAAEQPASRTAANVLIGAVDGSVPAASGITRAAPLAVEAAVGESNLLRDSTLSSHDLSSLSRCSTSFRAPLRARP